MLNFLRIRFLRVLAVVGLISISVSSIFNGFINGADITSAVICLITIWVTVKYPRSTLINILFPLASLLIYVVHAPFEVEKFGHIVPSGYFLFPIYTFFLLGAKNGLIVSLLLMVSLLIPLHLNSYDLSILGDTGVNFLFVYLTEVAILFALEIVNIYIFRQINKSSNTDSLTGLSNNHGFLLELKTAVGNSEPFYIILTDFDHFSRINSNLGFSICNTIIQQAAMILSEDAHVLHISRYYGDQFGILFTGTGLELTEYLRKKQILIRGLANELDIDIDITISSGMALYPQDATTDEQLMAYSELALKDAKKEDRATHRFFTPSSLVETEHDYVIEKSLNQALDNGDIEVHFQPKIAVKSQTVTGMEALIRWVHPELGYIPPPHFIEVAERCGLIVKIGEYVIEHSLDHLKKCRDKGLDSITVSINISPLHILRKHFLDDLLELTSKYGVDPTSVYLEITENVMLQGEIKDHLLKIKGAGFKLSLDDFGTGYSSLNYLRQFSFDELKIDKCFTDGLIRNDKERKIFNTILSLANTFEMKTVIEGVEHASQVELIAAMGADEIQGWYYSKALSSSDFLTFVEGIS